MEPLIGKYLAVSIRCKRWCHVGYIPGSIGNNTWYPSDSAEYTAFYNIDGGDPSTGYSVNPVTGQPYAPQIVPRGDYTRVLAEFWADGIDSETPPGHWFEIYHYVTDQATFERSGKELVLN